MTASCSGVRTMFLEIAQVDIKPGQEMEFEAGVAKAAEYFKRAKGCKAMSLQRSVEKPSRYRLFLTWETVENHTKDFYGSADWAGVGQLGVASVYGAPV